jgi:DNA polymerase III alpha subunit
MTKIKSLTYVGKKQTYDIEVDHPDHQYYLENGLLTSNSHAVSYAINSYVCAYLQTYYEKEWVCAFLDTVQGSPSKRDKAISEIKSIGYSIGRIDINTSNKAWSVDNNKILYPSFLTCKGIGDSAVDEVLIKRPYSSIEDLLWDDKNKWKHTKFNKKSFGNLIKVEAFKSLDIVGPNKMFDNYCHMYKVIIDHYDELKKKSGKIIFKELILQYKGGDDWSNIEKAQHQKELMGEIDIDYFVSAEAQRRFTEKGIESIEEAKINGESVFWFVIADFELKQTKNRKTYGVLEAIGKSSKPMKVKVWGLKPDSEFDVGLPYIAKIKVDTFGLSCTSFNMKRIKDI